MSSLSCLRHITLYSPSIRRRTAWENAGDWSFAFADIFNAYRCFSRKFSHRRGMAFSRVINTSWRGLSTQFFIRARHKRLLTLTKSSGFHENLPLKILQQQGFWSPKRASSFESFTRRDTNSWCRRDDDNIVPFRGSPACIAACSHWPTGHFVLLLLPLLLLWPWPLKLQGSYFKLPGAAVWFF